MKKVLQRLGQTVMGRLLIAIALFLVIITARLGGDMKSLSFLVGLALFLTGVIYALRTPEYHTVAVWVLVSMAALLALVSVGLVLSGIRLTSDRARLRSSAGGQS